MHLGKGRPADFERVVRDTEYLPPVRTGAPVDRSLPHGVEISATGLILPKKLDVDQWQEIGVKLCTIDRAMQWAIGDWWAYGDHTYGTRKAAAIAKKLPYEFGSLMNLGSVARRVTSSFRNEAVSFSHHVAVAALPPEDQKMLLSRAAEFKWTVIKLQQAAARRGAEDALGETLREGEQTIGHNSSSPSSDEGDYMRHLLMRAGQTIRAFPVDPVMMDLAFLEDASDGAVDELVEEVSLAADTWNKLLVRVKEVQEKRSNAGKRRSARRLN